MPTVGRTLAAERARQGLDLEQASAVTKITTRALKSIEADDFEQLPGMIFARNFVRQYAQFLKLDPVALVEQFDHEQSVPEPQFSSASEQKRFHVPPMSRPRALDGNIVSAFVSLVLTMVVCAVALYAYQYWRSHRPLIATPPIAARQAPLAPASPRPTASKPSNPAPAVTPAAALNSPQAIAGAASVHVLITAKATCWTRITADGKVLFAGMLNAGETRLVNAASVVSVRAGNAGGLAVKLNGNDVPPLGPEGQVRTVSLTPAGAQVIAPTPEVSEPI
jgi:cytoskeletal protein RodZ